MAKSKLYNGDVSSNWTLHRIFRDLLNAFTPICPFFTHYLSTILYGNSSVDEREFPILPESCNLGRFGNLNEKTEDLISFNSMIWKLKKDSSLSLKSPINDVEIPNDLEIFSTILQEMHNINHNN